jgi:hypothetical protein
MNLTHQIRTGPYAGQTFVEKFWATVAKLPGGCWEWQGKRYSNGYGCFSAGFDRYLAHRVAFILAGGTLEGRDSLVCHHCDNPPCVNPSHLFKGTTKDNIQDKMQKGRQRGPRGERSSKAKLDRSDVAVIRGMRAAGETQKRIADLFHVSPKQISVICSGKQWGWL